MSNKLPIIDQLHNADGDRARADVLLRCPDAVVLKYEKVFLHACRDFPAGELFVLQRTNAMHMVRSAAGGLPAAIALELETLRAELSAYAAGAPVQKEDPEAAKLWPLDAPQLGQAKGPPSIDI
ncbi:hypothetical protein LB572_03100 [Mesorhizobium sp. BH1-1-5]|uniref:hypothetical protein n=1 Tax=Mesorhizobium sp. BH1-1-5 TaxID=2876661 RepID=UPI001CD032D0|nr:hypothetical protein [Mesorhizobium sp. BH1-1-5]MBZ9986080.1 hypothetical protein [Mesorhizobium sp. BH1-1-5]